MGKLVIFILGWIFFILIVSILLLKSIIMWDWNWNVFLGDVFGEEAYNIMFLIKK